MSIGIGCSLQVVGLRR